MLTTNKDGSEVVMGVCISGVWGVMYVGGSCTRVIPL